MKHFLTAASVCITLLLFTSNNVYAQVGWNNVYASGNETSSFCETSAGNIFGILNSKSVIKSANKGADGSWIQVTTSGYPTTNYNALAAYHNNVYLINFNRTTPPYQGKGFFLSTDQGVNWIKKINGLGVDTVLASIQIMSNGTIFVSALIQQSGSDAYKIYRSTDNGTRWTFVIQLTYDVIIVENSSGTYFLTDGTDMYTSSNSGVSFTKLTQPVSISLAEMVVASNDSIYMHSGDQGLVRSKDGMHWTTIARVGWPAGAYSDAFIITPKDTMFMTLTSGTASTYGVYMSSDLGKTWTKEVNGLPANAQISAFQFWLSKKTGYLFGGILASGIWRTTTTVYSANSVPTSVFTPVDYSDKLGLIISPNPATEITTIEYTLGISDFVSIDITDQTGNVVKTVLNQCAQSAGIYKQTVDLNGIKAGLYFVSVNSGTGRSVKKIIVH